jgi:hypothetical protein
MNQHIDRLIFTQRIHHGLVNWISSSSDHRRGKLLRERWGSYVMGSIRKKTARKAALLGVDDKIREESLRFAERLVQELREAGYEVSEDGLAWMLKPLN